MDSKSVSLNGAYIMAPRSAIPPDTSIDVLDNEWAKNAFLISDISIADKGDKSNRYWSSAEAKFTDGRLGCNIGINAKPQFTRYSDTRVRGRNPNRNPVSVSHTTGDYGMGRYYSEAIDDPSQTIYLRFGVPQFSGLLSFLSRAYDADMVSLARTGRASSLLYTASKTIGTITGIVAFPQLAAFILLGKAVSFMFSRPTSKFYTMKPTMHTYWPTVENLVNNIAVTRGLLPKILDKAGEGADRLGQPYRIDSEQLEYLNALMPEVFGGGNTIAGVNTSTNNYIQISAIVNRAQRVANLTFSDEYEKAKNDVNGAMASDHTGFLRRNITGTGLHDTYIKSSTSDSIIGMLTGGLTVAARLNNAFLIGNYKRDEQTPQTELNPISKAKPEDTAQSKSGDPGQPRGFMDQYVEYLDAEFRDGSQFAVFKVDHTGSVQEGFSNAVQDSDISSKLNGISSSVRQARFTFQDGNLTGSAGEAAIKGILGGAADVIMGGLDGLTFGFSNVLAGLGGAGYIDIPKYWQSSSATLPKSTYTMQLISPYGNVISQLQNIYIPLCMLLAGTLPLSTGKASYTSPFLCQLFDRGRCQVQLGMIESLSITRGTSNLAFSTKGNPLAIDVSFTVVDLSSIMHMPISSGGLFATDTNMDSDNIMSDYIAILAGQDLYTQMYAAPKARLNFAKAITKASRVFSPSAFAAMTHDALPDVIKNVIEGVNRGSAVIGGAIQ